MHYRLDFPYNSNGFELYNSIVFRDSIEMLFQAKNLRDLGVHHCEVFRRILSATEKFQWLHQDCSKYPIPNVANTNFCDFALHDKALSIFRGFLFDDECIVSLGNIHFLCNTLTSRSFFTCENWKNITEKDKKTLPLVKIDYFWYGDESFWRVANVVTGIVRGISADNCDNMSALVFG